MPQGYQKPWKRHCVTKCFISQGLCELYTPRSASCQQSAFGCVP